MRRLYLKALCSAVVATGVLSPGRLSAQIVEHLIPLTNAVWRFNQSNSLDGVNWTAPEYDDSQWQSGPSLLGYETSPTLLPLIRTTLLSPLLPGISCGLGHACYFRIHFNWPYPPGEVTLFLTNRVDDGAKYYLNGVEAANLRMYGGSAYCLTYTINESSPPGPNYDADTDEVLEMPSTYLHQGDNVLAVSVHQCHNRSSDIVFGCALTAIRWTPPVFTDPSEPTNRIVLGFGSTTLRVLVSGYPPPNYQWFLEGSPILGATNATWVISNMMPWNAGAYYCTVSNLLSSTNSRTATVTFSDDHTPPQLLGAQTDEFLNKVVVTFDEPVESGTAEDSSNYSLGDELLIISAVLSSDGRSVTLDLGPAQWLAENTVYTLAVDWVADVVGNPIAPHSTVTFRTYVLTRGFLNFAEYDTGPGYSVWNLINHPSYPDLPVKRLFLPQFDLGAFYADWSRENYGARITGLFIPPMSGNWTFYLSSDDATQLYLNPAGSEAAGKTLLTEEPNYGGPFSAHASTPQALLADQPYYLEALYKADIGPNYCRVAAKFETDPTPPDLLAPIPGSLLGCYTATQGISLTLNQQPRDQRVTLPATLPWIGLEAFTNGNGFFTVANEGFPSAPWQYDAFQGLWLAGASEEGHPSASRLTSPPYLVTESTPVTLRFLHRYALEYSDARYDGGQLRLSVNGGPFVAVPPDRFTAGGYDGIITGQGVLEGQPGFNGESPGFILGSNITSIATLGPFNPGDSFAIQFLLAWDEWYWIRLQNWAIDSIEFDPPVQRPGAEAPVTFTVQASAFRPGTSNAPLAYQWQRNDAAGFVDLPQETSSSCSLRPFLADDGAQFRCIVRTPGLCVTSQVARLTVVTDSGQPRLSIGQSGGTVTVSWPLPADGWVLEQTATLSGATILWSEVPPAQYQTNATDISLQVSPPSGNRFYRLRKP